MTGLAACALGARLTRLLEALADGEVELAFRIGEDLDLDVSAWLAGSERENRS